MTPEQNKQLAEMMGYNETVFIGLDGNVYIAPKSGEWVFIVQTEHGKASAAHQFNPADNPAQLLEVFAWMLEVSPKELIDEVMQKAEEHLTAAMRECEEE